MDNINKSFGLGLIGFNNHQKNNFLAILSLAERRLQHSWQVVELGRADFFLFATEKSQTGLLLTKHKLPIERCLFCSGQEQREANEVWMDESKIPRLGSVVEVLNKIAKLSFAEPTASVIVSPVTETNTIVSAKSDDVFFIPEQSLLKHLLANTPEKWQIWDFKSPSGSYLLYIDFAGKFYYCETELKNLGACLSMDDAITVRDVSEVEWNNLLKQGKGIARPLINLIWYIAFKLSRGRLLQGHSSKESVYLTRWPDLSVQDCGRYVKLAAFMRNNAVCLSDIANKTSIALSEVHDFYNACYLIGIIEKTTQPEPHTKVLDDTKQQLLAKITNRLKKINNHEEG
jgi:hypothetical protein